MLVCILTKVKRQNYFSVSSGNVSNKGVLYRMKAENNKSGKESCKKKESTGRQNGGELPPGVGLSLFFWLSLSVLEKGTLLENFCYDGLTVGFAY
jgi:hypothetical protein